MHSEEKNIIYYYFLFIKNGLCIFEKNLERNNNIGDDEYNNLRKLVQKIVSNIINISNNDNKNKNKEVMFCFNRFILNKYKISILVRAKIALVGIFSINSSRGFQNLLLIHLYISLINFKGDSITKLNIINNYINNPNDITYYSIQEFQEEKNGEIINNNIKGISKVDFLEIFLYDKFFLKYSILHFEKVFDYITKKEELNLTFTKFLDLYIIDISSENLLFDLNEIIKYDSYSNFMNYKYFNNKNIFKEILFHSHQLNDSYISKYGSRFIKSDSSQRFIKFECTSTYPRILFIIKFIPVLKGIIIVHIYYQSKLSRGNNNISINHENKYKEVDLVFGSFFGENGEMDLKYVMPKKLGNIEKFMEEFFLTTRSSDLFKLNEPLKEFVYFDYNIIKIINSIPVDTINESFQKIFEYINDKLISKYKEENEKHIKKKIKKKHLYSDTFEESHDNNNNTLTIKKGKKIDGVDESLDKIFLIDKKILCNDLFPNQLEKFITIQNNFSTIKSNNNNIINILRDSDSSIKNNNPKNNPMKENTKTITLMSESNLIPKDDENNNEDLSKDFSLISAIKKDENTNLFKLKYTKNENTNLKNMNLQDILNTSSILKDKNLRDKIKHTEESVSDLINKDFNSNNNINITIKKKNIKSKKGKPRSKLVLLNDDL